MNNDLGKRINKYLYLSCDGSNMVIAIKGNCVVANCKNTALPNLVLAKEAFAKSNILKINDSNPARRPAPAPVTCSVVDADDEDLSF